MYSPPFKLFPSAVSALLVLAADPPALTQGTEPVKGATLLIERHRAPVGPSRRTVSPAPGPQLVPRNLARGLIEAFRKTETKPPNATPQANTVRARGEALTRLYQRCAPAVAVIIGKGGSSFGSGFLISEDGWLLTNHHVAEDAGLSDSLTYEMTVILGALSGEGYMEPLKETYSAEVYKWDQVRDLALLKLRDYPVAALTAGGPRAIKVATKSPAVGEDAVAIGNASVALLWSIKPGHIQAVGRNPFDSPSLLALWEEARQANENGTLDMSLDQLKAELETAVGSAGKVLHIQASCPILPGDSGGPLLNMNGEAVGVSAFGKADKKTGGTANYFVHQREISAFLKDRPSTALVGVPAFWDVEAPICAVTDGDGDGRLETMECFELVPDPDFFVLMNRELRAVAWDLKGATSFEKYRMKETPDSNPESGVDVVSVYEDQAMRFQVYAVLRDKDTVLAYDLDGDGFFERVRTGNRSDGLCAREFLAERRGEPYTRRTIEAEENLYLPAKELPEAWRVAYEKAVLTKIEKAGP